MRILHVLDHSSPLHSGYSFRTQAILEQQKSMGFDTFQITGAKQGKYKNCQEMVDGVKFYRTKPGFLSTFPVLNQCDIIYGLYNRLKTIVAEIKPDIIHAHSPALNGLAALKAAKQFNTPFVYEVRAFWEDAAVDHKTTKEGSLRYKFTRYIESYTLKKADAVICICDGLKNDIIARGIPGKKITLVPNAVNLNRFNMKNTQDISLNQKLKLEGHIVLGFIGSFYAYEGLDLLIESLPAIIKHYDRVKLLLVGGGNEEAILRDRINSLNLERHVVFVGRVHHDMVSRYYSLVDIFVYPRKSMRLTELVTPLKPIEAMASGKLVVASNVGGHCEIIKHEHNGYLFKANDHNALSNTIIGLVNNRKDWAKITQRARRYVEHLRNWRVVRESYGAVYSHILDE